MSEPKGGLTEPPKAPLDPPQETVVVLALNFKSLALFKMKREKSEILQSNITNQQERREFSVEK